MTMHPRIWPFATALGIFALDRCTKWLIETRVAFWEIYPVIPGFFQIVHTKNPGIAFGLFSDTDNPAAGSLLIVFSLLVLGFISTLLWQHTRHIAGEHWTLRLGLAFVLGGAIGNLYDRVIHGSVTDFLDFHYKGLHFPVFNAADSAITVGAVLLLINLWTGHASAAKHDLSSG